MARKPLVGTVAANVLEHGTGALNIDGCRVATNESLKGGGSPIMRYDGQNDRPCWGEGYERKATEGNVLGRWPANLIHDGSDEVVAGFPTTGPSKAAPRGSVQRYDPADAEAKRPKGGNAVRGIDDNGGSAARFFYCAKASRADRNEGLHSGDAPAVATGATMREREDADWPARNGNHHPTVKPTDLMAYLCRLVTPPGGVVLDPFMGSGSTGKAAVREGFRFIGCELSPEYLSIARARIEHERAKALAAAAPAPAEPQAELFQTA